MRLKESEVQIIKKAIHFFNSDAIIYLFGSRVDDNQIRAGNETNPSSLKKCR